MDLYSYSDSFNSEMDAEPRLFKNAKQCAGLVRKIADRLRHLGVVVNQSCRLDEYGRYYERHAENSNSFEVSRFSTALLECLQFMVIAEFGPIGQSEAVWIRKVETALGGHFLAADDRDDAKARSEQFELYLAAVLFAAGNPVEFAEPDLVVQTQHGRLAIAAKRPRSEAKIRKNVIKGARQVRRHAIDGVVAVDLSFVNELGKPIFLKTISQQQVPSKVLLDGYLLENRDWLVAACTDYKTTGTLAFFSCAAWTVDPVAHVISRRWVLVADRMDDRAQAIVDSVQLLGARPHESSLAK